MIVLFFRISDIFGQNFSKCLPDISILRMHYHFYTSMGAVSALSVPLNSKNSRQVFKKE